MRSGLVFSLLLVFVFYGCASESTTRSGLSPLKRGLKLELQCDSQSSAGPNFTNNSVYEPFSVDGNHVVYLDEMLSAGNISYVFKYFNSETRSEAILLPTGFNIVVNQVKLQYPYLYFVTMEDIAGTNYLVVNRFDVDTKLNNQNQIVTADRLNFSIAQGTEGTRTFQSRIDLFLQSKNHFVWRITKLYNDNTIRYEYSACEIDSCWSTIRYLETFSAPQLNVGDARLLENIATVGDFEGKLALAYSKIEEPSGTQEAVIYIKRFEESNPTSVRYSLSDSSLSNQPAGTRVRGARFVSGALSVQAILYRSEITPSETIIRGSHRIYELREDDRSFIEILQTVSSVPSASSRSGIVSIESTEAADFSTRAHSTGHEISLYGFSTYDLQGTRSGQGPLTGTLTTTYQVGIIETTPEGTSLSSNLTLISDLTAQTNVGPAIPPIPSVSGVQISGDQLYFGIPTSIPGEREIRFLSCSVE